MRTASSLLLTLAVVSAACLAQTQPDHRAGSLAKQEPQSIYAVDPQDAWTGAKAQLGPVGAPSGLARLLQHP
jgi:hypothetical protein